MLNSYGDCLDYIINDNRSKDITEVTDDRHSSYFQFMYITELHIKPNIKLHRLRDLTEHEA